jgi:hypothetical protein
VRETVYEVLLGVEVERELPPVLECEACGAEMPPGAA